MKALIIILSKGQKNKHTHTLSKSKLKVFNGLLDSVIYAAFGLRRWGALQKILKGIGLHGKKWEEIMKGEISNVRLWRDFCFVLLLPFQKLFRKPSKKTCQKLPKAEGYTPKTSQAAYTSIIPRRFGPTPIIHCNPCLSGDFPISNIHQLSSVFFPSPSSPPTCWGSPPLSPHIAAFSAPSRCPRPRRRWEPVASWELHKAPQGAAFGVRYKGREEGMELRGFLCGFNCFLFWKLSDSLCFLFGILLDERIFFLCFMKFDLCNVVTSRL